MKDHIDRGLATDLARRALAAGGEVNLPDSQRVSWDCSRDCRNSRTIELQGSDGRHHRPDVFVDVDVTCRKCPECLNRRGLKWSIAAKREIENSRRTWMLTLTCKPEIILRSRLSATANFSGDIDLLSDGLKHQQLLKELSKDITLYLKRVRESVNRRWARFHNEERVKFRYLWVAERHKSGNPHFHALVHEQHGSASILWEDLADAWSCMGFSLVKLVDEHTGKAAWYVAKYLTKSADARIRSSLRYGSDIDLPVEICSSKARSEF